MRSGSVRKVIAAALLAIALAACRQSAHKSPPIGVAYVGPAVLNIRSDFPIQSAAVATVKHGDRLEILGRRRLFLRVRTPNGAEGWTDERQLLSAADMDGLRNLTARAAGMPSQGQASTYGDLNVHTRPARLSPSFLQVKEGAEVDVLAQLRTPRADQARKPLIPPTPKKAAPVAKKAPPKQPKIPLPPMPKAPAPPENWLELSKSNQEEGAAGDSEPEVEEKPAATDDWSLVRTAAGQTGWVLTRRLTMAIPDEVAQYAEGHRIVSYFPLGAVDDGGEKKNTWLWTTVTGSGHAYDFDNIRVFTWGTRRHRYETAYIERNLKGYSPVLLETVEYGKAAAGAKYGGFSVCVEKKDGSRARRQYAVLGNSVRYAGERPCEPPPAPFIEAAPAVPGSVAPLTESAPPPAESFTRRLKKRVAGWFGK